MQTRIQMLSQQNIAGDNSFFRHSRPAGKPQIGGNLALVHLSALSEAGLLRMLGDHTVKSLYIFKGTAHNRRIVNAHAIIREHTNLRLRGRHRTNVREEFAFQPNGHRADGLHTAPTGLFTQPVNLLNYGCGICNGKRVCHRKNSRVAA